MAREWASPPRRELPMRVQTPAQRARKRAYMRQYMRKRYHEDQAFRERHKEYVRDWYQRSRDT